MQKKNNFCSKNSFTDLFLDDYDYSDWFVSPIEGCENVPPMSPLEGDEEKVKKGKGIKI